MEARDSEWHWHQLGHMQVGTSLQTDNHASNPPLRFFTGQMSFLSPNQQRQSTEGRTSVPMCAVVIFGRETNVLHQRPITRRRHSDFLFLLLVEILQFLLAVMFD